MKKILLVILILFIFYGSAYAVIVGYSRVSQTTATCSITPSFSYTTLDSWATVGQDIFANAYKGVKWETVLNACSVEFYLQEIGDVDAIDYIARIYEIDGSTDLSTLIATSSIVSGALISSTGDWQKFEFNAEYALNGRVIVVSRSDETVSDAVNYLRLNTTFNASTDMNTVTFDSSGTNINDLDRATAIRIYENE